MSLEPVLTIAVGVWLGGSLTALTIVCCESLAAWWRDKQHIQLQARVRR